MCFENDVCILGNYNKTSAPLTQNEEITALIKFSEVNANYIEIGNKGEDELNIIMDELIFGAYESEKKSKKRGCNKGGSLKECLIF